MLEYWVLDLLYNVKDKVEAHSALTLFPCVLVSSQLHDLEMVKFCLLLRVFDFNLNVIPNCLENVLFKLVYVSKIDKTSLILSLLLR